MSLSACSGDSRRGGQEKEQREPKPAPSVPSPDKPILFQPAFFRGDAEPAFQGTGFLVKAPNGRVAGVTSAHFIDPRDPAVTLAVWYDVAGTVAKAQFRDCWGLPGKLGIDMERTDRTADYLVMPAVESVPDEMLLELDPREKPDLHEWVWLPNKSADVQVGYRLVEGEVVEAETTHIAVRLDSYIKLESQSGSPFISQKTGKVIGTLSSYRATPAHIDFRLLLCPAHSIRKVLAKDEWFPSLSQTVGRPSRLSGN